ncbi:MAG TPA: hypothetical protein VGO59_15070 [Verrucomicrobiae bacterium]|jgi:hypothetical protein
MADSRQLFRILAGLGTVLFAFSTRAGTDDELLTGPAFAKFHLTLTSGCREEAAGPFYYNQNAEAQTQWAIPPFFCRTLTPEADWSEWDFLYPLADYRRFGKEHRLQLLQFLSFSGGESFEENAAHRSTFFPFYFRQRSKDTNLNYTAVFPFGGHLENRLFRDDIKFILFPIYSETRKKDVVTDNYVYPMFDRRRGNGLAGWQAWPVAGHNRKTPTLATNSMQETETVGGFDKWFAAWPFYFKTRDGLGTTNPASSLTIVPFYSQARAPLRDQTSYGFPFGFNSIHDREQGYEEHDLLWPLFVQAHGSKTVHRWFPFYSRAEHDGLESIFYGFIIYKYNRLQSPPLDRRRTRILYFLYSDTVERNTQSHDFKRRVDVWPFYSYHRELDGKRRTQVLAVLEPFLPNNRTIVREYSQVWSFWRAEKNPQTGATSQSLLWNLYRHERVGKSKKASLLFGLFQYQSSPEGGHWRIFYHNFGRQPERAEAAH